MEASAEAPLSIQRRIAIASNARASLSLSGATGAAFTGADAAKIAPSLSMIVTTPVLSAIVALVGLLSTTVKVSVGSLLLSLAIVTVKVFDV